MVLASVSAYGKKRVVNFYQRRKMLSQKVLEFFVFGFTFLYAAADRHLQHSTNQFHHFLSLAIQNVSPSLSFCSISIFANDSKSSNKALQLISVVDAICKIVLDNPNLDSHQYKSLILFLVCRTSIPCRLQ